jgi:hypothetical protein
MEADPSMSRQPDQRHSGRRVVLPSGKTIDVVYYDGERPARPGLPTRDQLHLCGACSSRLVYPLEWSEAGDAHWQVTLRCPNCEWAGTGVFGQSAVERLDEELDLGTEAMVRDLKRLVRANMEEQVQRFVDALRDDHIVPDDF